MKISKPLRDELIFILKKLVQIPSENPPDTTEEIVNFLIADVSKEEQVFQNQVVVNIKKGIDLHNLVSTI